MCFTGLPAEGGFDAALRDTRSSVCTGTRIATPLGDCSVDRLRVGDIASTVPNRKTAIADIHRQHVVIYRDCAYVPIRIRAGALRAGLPRQDV